jgi:O-acetylserine/cysteine efflux transporter
MGSPQELESLLRVGTGRMVAMPRRHVILAVAAAVVWGFNFVPIHWGLESFPPLLFAALRFTLVAIPAVFFIKRPDIPWRYVVGVGIFLSALQFSLLFVSMDQGLPAGLASVVVQLQPLFTIGLAVAFLGETPTRKQLLGSGIALAGIGVIATGRAEAVPLGAILLAIAASASWGAGNVLVRKAQAPDPISLLVWSSLIAIPPLFALSLVMEGRPEVHLTGTGVIGLLYVVVLASGFGYGVWTWLLQQYETAKVAPFSLLVPVTGLAGAWMALGEVPNAAEAAGAAIVLAGLAVLTGAVTSRPRRNPRPRPRTSTSPRPESA